VPAGGFSAYGYDAALVILSAIKKVAQTDADGNLYMGRTALRDAMFATKDLPGLTGSLTCTENGDCGVPAYVIYEFVDPDMNSFQPGTNPKQVYP
jgi:branched-chain amino acid transport system substrate-binding protein